MIHEGGRTVSRRRFLAAGGLATGHLLLRYSSSIRGGSDRGRSGSPVEIRMRLAHQGAVVWFEPVGLRVGPGATVRWVVERGAHTATAYHPDKGDYPLRIPEYAAPWDSGYLTAKGERFEHTFRQEGVYDYFCRPHEAAGMVGRIVVARPDRTDHRELPGWDGGARETELSPRDGEGARSSPLPREARTSFPSVSRILEEGRVTPVRAGARES